MTSAVIAAVAIVASAGYGMAKVGRFVAAQWFLVRLWRWFSGQAHHGHPVTDAGWFRKGERPLTRTGHATRWWHLPRWKRAAHRTGGTLAAAAVVFGLLVNAYATALAAGCLSLSLCVFGAWRLRRRRQAREA